MKQHLLEPVGQVNLNFLVIKCFGIEIKFLFSHKKRDKKQ